MTKTRDYGILLEMTQEEFFKYIEQTYHDALAIVAKKNKDYATDVDPFKNFKLSSLVGVSPARAILVRISDKMARVVNLLEKPASVKDETVEDTIVDMINYLAILKAYIHDQQSPAPDATAPKTTQKEQ